MVDLPLLLCLAVSEQRRPVECLVKTKPDALIGAALIYLNHMVDLLNLQRLHLTMFRLQPGCRHLNLTPAMHVTEIIKRRKFHERAIESRKAIKILYDLYEMLLFQWWMRKKWKKQLESNLISFLGALSLYCITVYKV